MFVRKVRQAYGDWDKYTLQSLPAMLNCDSQRAKSVYLNGLYQQAKFHLAFPFFFFKHGQSLLTDELQKVKIKNPQHIVQVSEAGRPVIFLSIHMGMYYMGFLKLANTFRTERTINIVKLTKASKREVSISNKISQTCPNIQFIRFDYRTGERIYSELKSNNAVVMMMDRETRVEDRTTVTLLGRQCHIQNGPAKLAVATKAIIVPVINYIDTQSCNNIEIGKPIDGRINTGEVARTAVDRITAEFVHNMEKWLTSYPDQMHCWPCIMSTIKMKKTDKVKQTFRYS
jgi:lauroyl/myristoyl acyltransferase